MEIPFEYPVASQKPNLTHGSRQTRCKGTIKPIQLDREPYEITLEARGYSFHLIFGSQINGNFLCIPNWQFGCELGDLTSKAWNLDSILRTESQLEYEDATAIIWGLSFASELIH